MSKTLILCAIDHETKGSLGDAIDIAASGAVKGNIRQIAAVVAARPLRKKTLKGLFSGDYTLDDTTAAAVGVRTITVRRSKQGNPYLLLDGVFYPAGADRPESYDRCHHLVTSGVAVMTPESIAKREEKAARYAAREVMIADQETSLI
jgi:hypothetical protein